MPPFILCPSGERGCDVQNKHGLLQGPEATEPPGSPGPALCPPGGSLSKHIGSTTEILKHRAAPICTLRLQQKELKLHEPLTSVAQLVGHHPAKQKVSGSIAGQGTCLGCRFSPRGAHAEGNPLMFLSHINVPLLLSPSVPLSLKINK